MQRQALVELRPISIEGLSEVIGSWKTMPTFAPRIARRRLGAIVMTSSGRRTGSCRPSA
jgi:hypothetical protein